MGFSDRIAACNNGDVTQFVPFFINDQRYGWLRPEFAGELRKFADVFQDGKDRGLSLTPKLDTFDTRSDAVDQVIQRLHKDGLIRRIHGEKYPICHRRSDAPLMQIDRASAPYFGIRAWGVHMNGYVRDGGRLKMWIARRAKDKPNYPGLLDNMVAGGQPIGLGLMENLIKECAEEAGIPAEIARTARPVGQVSYHQATRDGIKPDIMLAYDLEVPADFVPVPTDGEVDSFQLMDMEEVIALVQHTEDFKPNCALIIIDFLIRHGLLNADNTPDYCDLVVNLRR